MRVWSHVDRAGSVDLTERSEPHRLPEVRRVASRGRRVERDIDVEGERPPRPSRPRLRVGNVGTEYRRGDRAGDAYSAGTPLADLALAFGIHRSTVSAHIKRGDVEPRSGLIERNIEEATRLYNEGLSVAAVGQHFGVHGSTVLRVLKAAGVAIRPSRRWR